jgi:hypothetical protein
MGFETDRNHAGTEDAVVAALLELHRKKQRAQRPTGKGGGYVRVLEHFEKRGQRLRGERLVTEELLGRLVDAARSLPPPAVQQALEIAGPIGGVALGRFRITNRSAEHTRVDLVVGEPLEGPSPAGITFDPAKPTLAPGETRLVRITVDLETTPAATSSVLPVEARGGGRRDRLWLTVTAFDPRMGER